MFVRLYTGEDGLSHFEELDTVFKWRAQGSENMLGGATEQLPAEGYFFETFPPGYFVDLHVAPRRRVFVTLRGQVEVGNGAGEKRVFGPGDVMLAEDLTGKGHYIRMVGNDRRYSVVANLKGEPGAAAPPGGATSTEPPPPGDVEVSPDVVSRVYSGEDSLARVENTLPLEVYWKTEGQWKGVAGNTRVQPATGVFFETFPPDFFDGLHTTSFPRVLVTLRGEVDIGNEAGETWRFRRGGVMMAECYKGSGYSIRMVGDEQRYSMVIRL